MSKLSDKLKQVGALNNGRGIQNLLNAADTILENPIAMFDTEYRLQAYTDTVADDPIWNELITYGSFSYDTQVLFVETGFVDAVANAETIAFLISDKVKYDRILGKLYNKNNIHVANLIMIASNRPFDDEDMKIFEAVCKLISIEMIKSEFYQTYGNMYRETYIRKLIDGEITEKALYAAHIAIVYSNFKSSMRLVVADIGKNNPAKYSKLTYFRDLFSQAKSEFGYAIYLNYILIIINSDDKGFDAKRDLGEIYGIFEQNGIYGGVSNSFDNLYELQKYFLEAVSALNSVLNKNLDGYVKCYGGAE